MSLFAILIMLQLALCAVCYFFIWQVNVILALVFCAAAFLVMVLRRLVCKE